MTGRPCSRAISTLSGMRGQPAVPAAAGHSQRVPCHLRPCVAGRYSQPLRSAIRAASTRVRPPVLPMADER
jgi:hypothetical protein